MNRWTVAEQRGRTRGVGGFGHRWHSHAAWIVAWMLLGSSPALASVGPIDTDRPDFTDGVNLVPTGHLQLEGGGTFGRHASVSSYSLGESLVRMRLDARIEGRVAPPSLSWSNGPDPTRAALGDLGLGLKIALHEASAREWVPSLASEVLVTFPTAAIGHGGDATVPELKLCADWNLSDHVSLDSNLNALWPVEDEARFMRREGSASLGVDLSEQVQSFFECYGFDRPHRQGSDQAFADAGILLRVTDQLQLDARLGFSLTHESEGFAGAGVSRRW